MSKTLSELNIILYLCGYGIFLTSCHDLIKYLCIHLKKWCRITIEILFSFGILYITYRFAHQLNRGDITFYVILFLLAGIILYNLYLRKGFLKGLVMLSFLYYKIKGPFKKIFVFLFIPKATFWVIKTPFGRVGKTFKSFFNKFRRKK